MSNERWLIAIAAVLGLAFLLSLQHSRERIVARCLEDGGRWHGTLSWCEPDPNRVIIMRKLERT